MSNEVEKRKNLKFSEIEKLSQNLQYEYNETIVGELGFSRYGMNHILKNYADLPNNFKIHALFEHGIHITDYAGGSFRAHEYLPSIVASKYRIEILKNENYYNGAYAIGPYIHYAPLLLSKEKLQSEKERLGKTLLVFPTHSIEGLVTKFDIEEYCTKIKELSSDYDSVRICMYYKDIQLGNYVPYEEKGFEVVTAGHFNDYYFLPRLKSIIETSDMTMSNEIGTHLGYCIYLDKPHYLFKSSNIEKNPEKNDKNSKLMINNENESIKKKNSSDNVNKISYLFKDFKEEITSNQKEIISYLWGFSEVKTRKELHDLFMEINSSYSWLKYYLSGFKRLKDILSGNR